MQYDVGNLISGSSCDGIKPVNRNPPILITGSQTAMHMKICDYKILHILFSTEKDHILSHRHGQYKTRVNEYWQLTDKLGS